MTFLLIFKVAFVATLLCTLLCSRLFAVCCPREEQDERDAASMDVEE